MPYLTVVLADGANPPVIRAIPDETLPETYYTYAAPDLATLSPTNMSPRATPRRLTWKRMFVRGGMVGYYVHDARGLYAIARLAAIERVTGEFDWTPNAVTWVLTDANWPRDQLLDLRSTENFVGRFGTTANRIAFSEWCRSLVSRATSAPSPPMPDGPPPSDQQKRASNMTFEEWMAYTAEILEEHRRNKR